MTDKNQKGVTVTRKIHHTWLPSEKPAVVGKWHYIYSSEKGEISLVSLPGYYNPSETLWEIYCLKGDLLEDIERFKTKKEAEKTIYKLLK